MTKAKPPTSLPTLDWSDLQALLALVRGGTLRRAASRHGTSAATLSRRLDHLEATLGGLLVERLPLGSQLTDMGRRVLAHAEAMERLAGDIERVRDTVDRGEVEGTVRINADEWVSLLLTRRMAPLRAQHPGLHIEILTTHRPISVGRGEVDVAVRPFRPASGDMISRTIGTMGFGLYASSGYVRAHVGAVQRGDWRSLQYVGFDERHGEFEAERWLRAWAQPTVPWLRSNYALGIYDGILADAGLGVLAQFIVQGDQRLVALVPEVAELRQRYWLAYHRSVRQSARVRLVADCIVQAFADLPG